MFIDASALTAMLVDEDDARELLARLQATSTRLTSPLAVWETAIAVARVLDLPFGEASAAVTRYLAFDRDRRCARRAGDGGNRAVGLRALRQGPSLRAAQFWRLLRICLRPAPRPAADVSRAATFRRPTSRPPSPQFFNRSIIGSVMRQMPLSVRRKRAASCSGSSPTTSPSGILTPRSMMTRRRRAPRPISA